MKKIRLMALIIVVSMIMQMFALGVYASEFSKDGELKLNIELGYNGTIKLGSTVPVFLKVENNLKDINGELQVEFPNDYNDITIYSLDISLPKNTTKEFVMYLPYTRVIEKLNVNIVQGKSKILTKTIRPGTPLSADTLIIAMLSDDYESIRYIDKIPMKRYNSFKTISLNVNETVFPDNVDALRMFNVLIINNFDTTKLNAAQYEAIKQWVGMGGLLLIGTGPSYTKTLSIFKDDFITGEIKELSNVSTNVLHSMMNNGNLETMKLDVLNMKLEAADIIASEAGIPLIQKLNKGKGAVALAAFDFGLEPLTSWIGNKSFAESLMSSILPASYNSDYFDKMMYMQGNYYSIDNSLRNIPELPQPNPFNLLVIFGIYILLAAPISYIILKKMDKRELLWVTVPIFSVVFAVIMYFTGYGTRLTEPLANVVSIVNIDKSGTTLPTSFAGVFTPNKINMKIETDDITTLKPMLLYDDYRYSRSSREEEGKVVSKITLAPKPAVEFYKAGVWSMKNVILENNKLEEAVIESDLTYYNSKITGTIKNLTRYNLKDCYLITNNQYIYIGDIKIGETINVDNGSKAYYGNTYDLANALYKEPQHYRRSTSKLSAAQIRIFRENMQKRQILEYYFWKNGEGSLDAKLIGWSTDPVVGEILVNSKSVRKYEKSFVAADVNLNFRYNNTVEYPKGYIKPAITASNFTQGSYDEMGRTFYGSGSVEISFPIEADIEPTEIIIDCGAPSPNSKKYMYNYQNASWEELKSNIITIKKDSMNKYFNSNRVTLKLELNNDSIPIPQISLKGSVK